VAEHQTHVAGHGQQQSVAAGNVRPFGCGRQQLPLAHWIGQVPGAEERHAKASGCDREVTDDRHQEHGEVEHLLSTMHEYALTR